MGGTTSVSRRQLVLQVLLPVFHVLVACAMAWFLWSVAVAASSGESVETLREASEQGKALAVERALNHGIAPDAHATRLAMTPLMFAARRGHLEVAKLLLSRGADVNATCRGPGSPLAMAAAAGRVEMTRLLLDHGADPNRGDSDGFTPLMHAGFSGDLEIIELLIGAGADVNARSRFGQTPLMFAAALERAAMARRLIAAGADTRPRDVDGEDAGEIAAEEGDTETAKLIRRAEALRR